MEARRFIQKRDDGDWVVVETGGGDTKLASGSICRYVQYEIKKKSECTGQSIKMGPLWEGWG